MVIRTHGGVITDQMLSGGLRFFRLSSAALGYFEHTVSTGTTKIPGSSIGVSNQRLLVTAQDETNYDGGANNGTFAGGTGYLGGITSDDYTNLVFTTGPDEITRSDGTAFDTDGVVVGQVLVIANAEDGGNNGSYTVTSVSATVIAVSETLIPNADDTTATIDVFDVLTLNDTTVITVDSAGTAGTGAPITEFTVAAGAVPLQLATTRTVSSETAGNSDFTLTPDTNNEIDTGGLFVVSPGQAVPNSVADRIFRALTNSSSAVGPDGNFFTGACTIVMINVIDDNNIHFACDDSGFSWDTPATGDAAAEMQAAVRALGVVGGGGALSTNPPVPDASTTGVPTRDLNVGGITITETSPFQLT